MSNPQRELEHRIRLRAYHFWEDEGCPESRAEEHWRRACAAEAARDAYELRIDIAAVRIAFRRAILRRMPG